MSTLHPLFATILGQHMSAAIPAPPVGPYPTAQWPEGLTHLPVPAKPSEHERIAGLIAAALESVSQAEEEWADECGAATLSLLERAQGMWDSTYSRHA